MIKFLIVSNVIVTNICCILFILLVIEAYEGFKNKHPTFIIPKGPRDAFLLGIVEFSLIAICPMLNIIFAYVLLSQHEEIKSEVVRKIEKKYGLVGES